VVTEASGGVRLVLLPSPLLGPAVWQPVARELGTRGWEVVVPAPYGEVKHPATSWSTCWPRSRRRCPSSSCRTAWTQWWESDDVDALFPDDGSRTAVESEQVRLPLVYFEAAVARLEGGHLHALAAPAGVAEVLERLLRQIGISGAGERPIRV